MTPETFAPFLPYGSTGILLAIILLGARFVGRMLSEALEAFKAEAKAQREAWQTSSREARDALQSVAQQVQLTKDALAIEIKESRHDARSALTAVTAETAHQLFQRLDLFERMMLTQFRELRDDLALKPRPEPSRLG